MLVIVVVVVAVVNDANRSSIIIQIEHANSENMIEDR